MAQNHVHGRFHAAANNTGASSYSSGCGGGSSSMSMSMNMNVNVNTTGNASASSSSFCYWPGFRFCPTDKELIRYLRKKINNEPLPAGLIHDVDLYACHPRHLYEKYGEPEEKYMYFFTPRNKKYTNGSRPNRTAGEGHWKASGRGVGVGTERYRLGKKTVLCYVQGKPQNPIKTKWIMHEFTIEDAPSTKRNHADMKLDDWVLCKVYKRDFDKLQKKDEEQRYVASEYPSSDWEISEVLDPPSHDQDAPDDQVIINNLNSSMLSFAPVITSNPNSSMPSNIRGEGTSHGSSFGYDNNPQGQVLLNTSGLGLESQNHSYNNIDPAEALPDNSNMVGEVADFPSLPMSNDDQFEVPLNPMQQLPSHDNVLVSDPFYNNLFGAPEAYDQQQLDDANCIIHDLPPL